MTPLASLWLPIVLSTVFVFLASSIVHMVMPWHKGDFAKLPDEDAFRPIGASAFRDRAGRILRDAAHSPRLITWYGRPAAAVVAAPEPWDVEEDEE